MTFKRAVEATPLLAGAFHSGLQALKRIDRTRVKAEDTRRIRGSVDLDSELKDILAAERRWDYGIGHKPANEAGDVVYWVEVHPATSGEFQVVIEKLIALKAWLRSHALELNQLPRQYVWISSNKTAFSHSAPQKKKMAALGLQHHGRVLTIRDTLD